MASTYGNLSVLLVDNASVDGSVEYVREAFPAVEVLENPVNEYFCRGNNVGLELILQRKPDYVFILNNDTELDAACIEKLAAFMESEPEAGGCQPMLLFMEQPDRVNSLGCRCSLSGKTWDRGFNEPLPTQKTPFQVLGATGGAMFLRRQALEKAGLFCPYFTMYSEDVDLSLRIWAAGFPLYCVPEAVILHKYGGTVSDYIPMKKIFFTERNSYWVVLRNYPLGKILKSFALCVPFRGAIAGYMLLRGKWRYAVCILGGLAVGAASFPWFFLKRALAPASSRAAKRFWPFMDEQHLIPPRHDRNVKE